MDGKIFRSTVEHPMASENVVFKNREPNNENTLKVFTEKPKQKIQGFGSSFTEGCGYVFNQMDQADQEKLIKLYFGKDGNHYNMARIPIQSCDFSLGNYEYVSNEQNLHDGKLNFSHDQEYIIPFIKASLAENPEIIFMASPWSPPAFMKTNQDMNKGGYLKKEYFADWARIVHAYFDFYLEHGIKIKKFSVQNEPVMVKPWDSCLYTNHDEADFLLSYLKAELENTPHEDILFYIWDHDKDGLLEWSDEMFADERFRSVVDGIAFHWYSGDHFEQVAYLEKNYPEKDLLFTEGCVPLEGFSDETQKVHGNTYIHDLINNFKFGTTGYIDWNILLDQNGGPNHMDNACEAPIMYDLEQKKLIVNYSYTCIQHLSRFVQRGASVVYSSVYDSKLEQVAFVNPDGSKVLVVYNHSEQEQSFRMIDGENEAAITLRGMEIITVVWNEGEKNGKKKTR